MFFSESKVLNRLLTECLLSDLMFNTLMEKSISATCKNKKYFIQGWSLSSRILVLSEFIAVLSFCTVLNLFYLLSLCGGDSFYCSLQSPKISVNSLFWHQRSLYCGYTLAFSEVSGSIFMFCVCFLLPNYEFTTWTLTEHRRQEKN